MGSGEKIENSQFRLWAVGERDAKNLGARFARV